MSISQIKQALRSKTVKFNLLIMALGVLQGFVFALPISPMWQAVTMISLGAAGIILRAVTDTALSAK